MIEGLASERRASEIGMQDYAGGIDYRQQRVAQRLSKLAFNCRRQAAKCEVERFFVPFRAGNSPIGNFLSQPRQHNATTFGNSRMPVAFNQLLYPGLSQQLVRRRQFLKQSGFVASSHWRRLCHTKSWVRRQLSDSQYRRGFD